MREQVQDTLVEARRLHRREQNGDDLAESDWLAICEEINEACDDDGMPRLCPIAEKAG